MAMRKVGGRRMHVILTELQLDKLAAVSARTGLTVAEHMRRAVDHYLNALERISSRRKK